MQHIQNRYLSPSEINDFKQKNTNVWKNKRVLPVVTALALP